MTKTNLKRGTKMTNKWNVFGSALMLVLYIAIVTAIIVGATSCGKNDSDVISVPGVPGAAGAAGPAGAQGPKGDTGPAGSPAPTPSATPAPGNSGNPGNPGHGKASPKCNEHNTRNPHCVE